MISRQNHSKTPQPLTFWRANDRHHQQARIAAKHLSHSPTEEPRTGIISKQDLQQDTTATHPLESQGQASSMGQKQGTTATHSLESQGQTSSTG
jgi:hypothetical protein